MKRELKSLGLTSSESSGPDTTEDIVNGRRQGSKQKRALRSISKERKGSEDKQVVKHSLLTKRRRKHKSYSKKKKKQDVAEQTDSVAATSVSDKPIGIINMGNTCYLNSVIQTLVHVPPLFQLLKSIDVVNINPNLLTEIELMGYQILTLVRMINEAIRKPLKKEDYVWLNEGMGCVALRPSSLVETIRGRDPRTEISGKGQKDAHEMLLLCFQAIEALCLVSARINGSSATALCLDNIICGQSVWEVKCLSCSNNFKRFEIWKYLSIPLQNGQTLQKSIDTVFQDEYLTGSNKYYCTTCERLSDAIQKHNLQHLPECLFLQLMVFEFKDGELCKSLDTVDIPKNLIMFSSNSIRYTLNAVISHLGHSLFSGHYVSIVRKNRKLFLCNDEEIEEVPASSLAGSTAEDTFSRPYASPYILAYSRKHN